MKINEIITTLNEDATSGGCASGSIATVSQPMTTLRRRTKPRKLKENDVVTESTDDPQVKAVINAVAQLIKQGHTEVSPHVITNMVVADTSQPFLLKDLVSANNNSELLQKYIDSIDPNKVKFSSAILTVKNEDPEKEREASETAVSNMASRAASRDRSLSETTINGREDTTIESQDLRANADGQIRVRSAKQFKAIANALNATIVQDDDNSWSMKKGDVIIGSYEREQGGWVYAPEGVQFPKQGATV